jgi:hypothetical protein
LQTLLNERDMAAIPPPPKPVMPAPKDKKLLRGCLILLAAPTLGVLLLIFIGVMVGPPPADIKSTQSTTPVAPEPPARKATPVSANDLYSQYDANEVSADDYYKGRSLLVTGRVGSINKGFLDNIYIIMPSSSNPYMGVHAELKRSEKERAGNLRKGEQITLLCIGAGKVLTDVLVKKCTFP